MSRETILAAVQAHQGDPVALPSLPSFPSLPSLLTHFKTALELVGGKWAERRAGDDLAQIARSHYPDAQRLVSTVNEPPGSTFSIAEDAAPVDLVKVELAIVRGQFGVAENAAIWIDDGQLPHRALPFVAEHLVVLLSATDIVTDMHAACGALANRRWGYGVFISGPSKTADIEQALVIGAQGPRSLLVVFDQS